MLRAEWRDDEGQPLHPVAYSVSEFGSGPVLPASVRDDDAPAAVLAKLGTHAAKVAETLAALPEIVHASEYDCAARRAPGRSFAHDGARDLRARDRGAGGRGTASG